MKNVFSVIRNLSLKIKHARHKEQGAPILKHKSEYVTGEKYSKSKIHSRILRILTVVPYIKNTFLLPFFFHLK